ncbi:hypothetical protein ACFE04_006748 [Oxalis oulophora]
MATESELVHIQPTEISFTIEVKKQSSCLIQLTNISDHYVAFKVKTTSPKRYCVRPNLGLIRPTATSHFTVTMQPPRVAPPDFECKDKFLIQTTIAPFASTHDDITSHMFVKGVHNYIIERKLKVLLLSSPVLSPHNRESKPQLGHEASFSENILSGVENITPPERIGILENVDEVNEVDNLKVTKKLQIANEAEESAAANQIEPMPAKPANEKIDTEVLKFADNFEKSKSKVKETDLKGVDEKTETDVLEFTDDFENLKSKLKETDLKLREAEHDIEKLMEEQGAATREKDTLKKELVSDNNNNNNNNNNICNGKEYETYQKGLGGFSILRPAWGSIIEECEWLSMNVVCDLLKFSVMFN